MSVGHFPSFQAWDVTPAELVTPGKVLQGRTSLGYRLWEFIATPASSSSQEIRENHINFAR